MSRLAWIFYAVGEKSPCSHTRRLWAYGIHVEGGPSCARWDNFGFSDPVYRRGSPSPIFTGVRSQFYLFLRLAELIDSMSEDRNESFDDICIKYDDFLM